MHSITEVYDLCKMYSDAALALRNNGDRVTILKYAWLRDRYTRMVWCINDMMWRSSDTLKMWLDEGLEEQEEIWAREILAAR